MQNTKPQVKDERPLFMFRVLISHESGYNVFIARCLETGSVATADDLETVKDMVQELLVDEVTFALEHHNLANLYSTPAALDVWMRFHSAQRNAPYKPMQRAIRARNVEEVPAEIEFARAA